MRTRRVALLATYGLACGLLGFEGALRLVGDAQLAQRRAGDLGRRLGERMTRREEAACRNCHPKRHDWRLHTNGRSVWG